MAIAIPDTNVDFLRIAKPLGILSVVLVVASIFLLGTRGLNFGLDFTGGTVVEVGAPQDISLSEVRGVLAEGGYGDAVVQHFGSSRDVMVRIPPQETDEPDQAGLEVFALVSDAVPDLELRRVEFVGPQVGDELRDQSGLAMLMALGLMLLYVWFRFTNKFGVATVAALLHDVIVVLGLFSLFQWSFDLTVLAAVLALIGYSLNDSIVVADHIRDDFRHSRMTDPVAIINQALNRTLSRTVVTSFTTLLVLVALYVFGGETMRGFSMALMAGVVIGTYSSIYVASNVLMLMNVSKEDFMVPQQEELDEMP
ncbi:protein translocase subunit SecF [Isoalcanivorax indicus]|uniref:protein translocase subunit SecF n=1 Tax=Isoalcanivorax indicus TaxID=2202653 RepID=UPI000DBAC3AF|nr:protein translocase subunit SecF [Isoalcanivorax indicus]